VANDLSPTGRAAVQWFAQKLRDGFSGKIYFEVNDGGIRHCDATDRISAKELLAGRWKRSPENEGWTQDDAA
jgi:hypothetical protein